MKYLEKSTQTPCVITEEMKAQNVHLPLPHPGALDEWRRYWNERTETETASGMGEDGEESATETQVTRADYVAVQNETAPTDEEWTAVLKEQGFTATKIKKILSSATE